MSKIGIFLHGQNGDIMTAMSVLKYRDQLWPGKDLVWFVNKPNSNNLHGHEDIEIRPFAHGWGYPDRCAPDSNDNINAKANGLPLWEDWSVLKHSNGKLCLENAKMFRATSDLEDGYFPAPYHIEPENRHGIDYPNVSRTVFGVDKSLPWHPVLKFYNHDQFTVELFINKLPKGRKNILIETFGGSGQSILSHEMVMKSLILCREKWGECNFIFASDKYLRNTPDYPYEIVERDDVFMFSALTVRQFGLVINYCDFMICVSSGISVATSHWEAKPVPKIQYCGSFICSTVTLARGPIHLVETDGHRYSDKTFFTVLNECLEKYK